MGTLSACEGERTNYGEGQIVIAAYFKTSLLSRLSIEDNFHHVMKCLKY